MRFFAVSGISATFGRFPAVESTYSALLFDAVSSLYHPRSYIRALASVGAAHKFHPPLTSGLLCRLFYANASKVFTLSRRVAFNISTCKIARKSGFLPLRSGVECLWFFSLSWSWISRLEFSAHSRDVHECAFSGRGSTRRFWNIRWSLGESN